MTVGLQEFTDWFDALAMAHPAKAYVILFLSAVVENVFPPAPGDTVTVFGAYLVGRGVLGLWPVVLSTLFGSTIGFMGLFLLGWRYGREALTRWHWVDESALIRAETLLKRKGILVVAVNRFLPGLRSVISISAGVLRLNAGFVTFATAFSVLLWNGLLIYAGMITGENWNEVLGTVQRYSRIAMVTLAAGAILIGIYLTIRHMRRKR